MAEEAGTTAVRAQILVSGRVQGVGYRAFAARVASRHALLGGVRNLDDGRVELDVKVRGLRLTRSCMSSRPVHRPRA